jgi:mono/diheme cytochrome c family protein
MINILLASALALPPKVYQQRCSQCHGTNGSGQIGPDIRGSSLELIRLKVLEGKYPNGYKPKRPTRAMPKLKASDKELESIYKFLNKCKNTCGG